MTRPAPGTPTSVIERVARVVNVVVRLAVPWPAAAPCAREPVPSDLAPTRNVTDPVGVHGPCPVTVVVNVTG